jgi:phospholipid/cholesterol/gamma-HCH transport system substrate-binding protein
MKSAAKVGLLVVVFLVLVLGSFSFLGRSLFPRHQKQFFVLMHDAGGVAQGSRVLMAGVEIGSVKRIGLQDPHTARLTLEIHQDINIPQGSSAELPGALIGLGESVLTIVVPADATKSTPGLPDGATLPGLKGSPLESVFPDSGKELYGRLNGTLEGVQKLLADQKLQKDIRQLLESSNETMKQTQLTLTRFVALSDRANAILAQNQGGIQGLVKATRGAIEQVQYTASTLAGFVKEGKLQRGTTEILNHAVAIENQASSLLGKLNQIAGDPALKQNISSTVQNIADTTKEGPGLAADAKKASAGIAEIIEKAKPLPDNLNTVATKASQLEDRLNALLDKVNGVKAPSTEGLKNLSVEMDLFRETNPGYWRTDLEGRLPFSGGFAVLGIYDAFESDRITAEIGHYFSKGLDYRYGVYASKPALGVDYSLTPRLSLRGDLWNINSPELDARLRYDFGGEIVGWLGVDRIGSGTAPTIGVGIRR